MNRSLLVGIRSLLLIAFSIFFLASPGIAADKKKPEATPESALSLFQKKTLDYALLEYGMLENRRTQAMTPSLQSQLIFVLERLVGVYCMPELPNTLEYVGPATGTDCLHHLKELEAMHPENPVALCSRHGIDSDSCKDAYDNQYVSYYSSPSNHAEHRIEDSADFLVRLNVPSEGEMKKLPELYSAESEYDSNKNAVTKKMFENVLSMRIRNDCNPTYYRMAYTKPGDEFKSSYKEKENEADPLRQLVAAFSSGEDLPVSSRGNKGQGRGSKKVYLDQTPVPKANGRNDDSKNSDYQALAVKKADYDGEKFLTGWRMRYLNSSCIPVIERALKHDHQFVDAICYREGFTAPNCIQALRARRARIEKARNRGKASKMKGGPQKKKDKFKGGFSSF